MISPLLSVLYVLLWAAAARSSRLLQLSLLLLLYFVFTSRPWSFYLLVGMGFASLRAVCVSSSCIALDLGVLASLTIDRVPSSSACALIDAAFRQLAEAMDLFCTPRLLYCCDQDICRWLGESMSQCLYVLSEYRWLLTIVWVCFRKTLVLRPTVLDGSGWTDAALILSLAGSVGTSCESGFSLLVLRIFTFFPIHAVPSSCSVLGIMQDYIHRVMY